MNTWRVWLTTLVCSLWLGLAAQPSSAQAANLHIEIRPEIGPAGSTVEIFGSSAAPNAQINVLYAPFDSAIGCRAGRDAQLVASVTADERGQFYAAQRATPSAADQIGITYLAKTSGPDARASNVACFTFSDAGPARTFPETGFTVSGRFLEYWEHNGGLPVFGYPIGPARQEYNADTGQTYLTQWFERNRFELHPENDAPYDVLLGRLGVERLHQQGIDWTTLPPGERSSACSWFAYTQHNVCDQANGAGFLTYWRSHGLNFDNDARSSFDESLALFGYPLTEAYWDTNSSGDTVLMQYFERARFEWHPANPQPFRVLLGRLGAELRP